MTSLKRQYSLVSNRSTKPFTLSWKVSLGTLSAEMMFPPYFTISHCNIQLG